MRLPWLLPAADGPDAVLALEPAEKIALFRQVHLVAATETPGLAAARKQFNRVEFGYGFSQAKKDAEKMAAAHLGAKLHLAGLIPPDQLHLEGEEKMLLPGGLTLAATGGPESSSGDARWWAADPKSAVVNFGVQQKVQVTFSQEDPPPVIKAPPGLESDLVVDPPQSDAAVTVTVPLAGRMLTARGAATTHKAAGAANTLQLHVLGTAGSAAQHSCADVWLTVASPWL